MSIYYSEFLATRRNVNIGWDMEELSGKHKILPDGRVKSRILKVINRFEYYDYMETGYFLFFDELLKKFICVQASKGKVIDRRTNMTITIRVPDTTEDDGFMECISLLKSWEKIPECSFEMKDICKNYDIGKEWLESFIQMVYKQAFSQEASPIQILSKPYAFESQKEMEFALNMMQMCYRLLPSSKKFRLSFGFRVPAQKAIGIRILIGKEAHISKCYLVGETPLNDYMQEYERKYAKMISRIIDEEMDGDETSNFADKIDQFYLHVTDYESMYWNYCYYILNEKGEFPCEFKEYIEVREDVKKQIYNGFVKAEKLYEGMIRYLQNQSLLESEYGVLLNDCLDLLGAKKCTHEQLDLIWNLISQYSRKQIPQIHNILDIIAGKYQWLYYQLIKTGIQKNILDIDYLLKKETFEKRMDIERWIRHEYRKDLLEEEKVKDMLMNVIEPWISQHEKIEEIKNLINVGCKIDKKRCFLIVEKYFTLGIANACKAGKMSDFLQFLNYTETLWKGVNSYEKMMESAYKKLACQYIMPIEVKEIRAFTEIRWNFSNIQQVQQILLNMCREILLTKANGDSVLEECLDILVNWETGISSMDYEVLQSRQLLEKLTSIHTNHNLECSSLDELLRYEAIGERKEQAYIVWLEKLNQKIQGDIPISSILEQLDKKRPYLRIEQCESTLLLIFKKLIGCAQDNRSVKQMLQIVEIADKFLEQNLMRVLMEMFWNGVEFVQFQKIYRLEKNIWKKRNRNTPLHYDINDNMRQQLYDIYQGIYSSESLENITMSIHQYLTGADRKQTINFLKVLMCEWGQTEGDCFERILDVLMVCWENENELFETIREVMPDKKEATQLIRKIQLGGFFEIKDVVPKEENLFWGTVIGAIIAIFSVLWDIVTSSGEMLPEIIFLGAEVFLFVGLYILAKQCLKKERTFRITTLAIGGILWSVFKGIYSIFDKVWISIVLLILILIMQGIYWFVSIKRKGL